QGFRLILNVFSRVLAFESDSWLHSFQQVRTGLIVTAVSAAPSAFHALSALAEQDLSSRPRQAPQRSPENLLRTLEDRDIGRKFRGLQCGRIPSGVITWNLRVFVATPRRSASETKTDRFAPVRF